MINLIFGKFRGTVYYRITARFRRVSDACHRNLKPIWLTQFGVAFSSDIDARNRRTYARREHRNDTERKRTEIDLEKLGAGRPFMPYNASSRRVARRRFFSPLLFIARVITVDRAADATGDRRRSGKYGGRRRRRGREAFRAIKNA